MTTMLFQLIGMSDSVFVGCGSTGRANSTSGSVLGAIGPVESR
jgi:hypothetical protein